MIAQPVVEPGLEDAIAVIGGGVGTEIDGAEAAAVAAPLPVIPGTGDEVVAVTGIVLLEEFVDFLRTIEILLVPPTGCG